MDFGGTSVSGIHCSVIACLRDFFGLEKKPVKVVEPYQMLGEVDSELKEIMGVSTSQIPTRYTMFGNELNLWKEWKTPWGQDVLIPNSLNITQDINGIYTFPKGNTSAKPSAFMPNGCFFFNAIEKTTLFDEDNLSLSDNLEEFKELSDDDIAYYKNFISDSNNKENFLICSHLPGTALGDVALIPAMFMENPKGVRGVQDWYMLLATNDDFVNQLFEEQCKIAIKNLNKIYGALGSYLDVAVVCGTDFGTQNSTFCSVEKYRNLWLPHYKVLNDWIHKNTNWKTFKHSCGAVEPLMQSFMDSGFDIINPVQCSATGMDPKLLKEKYGENLVFWGGAIDTQKVLPFGTPYEVKTQALQRLEIFSKNGGFMFNATHNVQAMTPTENMIALIDAFKIFNS